jgi:hypothetical protein
MCEFKSVILPTRFNCSSAWREVSLISYLTARVELAGTLQSAPERGARAGYEGAKRRKGNKVHKKRCGGLRLKLITSSSSYLLQSYRKFSN